MSVALYTSLIWQLPRFYQRKWLPLVVRDLQGTRLYERLKKAYETGEPVPKIPISLSSSLADDKAHQEWGATFDDTIVYVERVISYWSRSLKPAETRYSATEREALAAKEGLVKFQPFIEGEKFYLSRITQLSNGRGRMKTPTEG